MYAAILVFIIGTSLLLGAGYGLLVGMMFALVLARRAVLEEHALRSELPGYEAYMAQVRYRLIPHVW
jgi:protein-S-isoprenylcysteine O-methyltransferase Ste14